MNKQTGSTRGGRRHKIIEHGLEKKALALRGKGHTNSEAAAELNRLIKARGSEDTITPRSLQRYYATLDEATLPVAHQPQVAEANAEVAINVGRDLERLSGQLREWFDEATAARLTTTIRRGKDDDGEDIYEPVDAGPDWRVRLNTAREFRELLKLIADVLERINNAERIQIFQQTVMETVAEADPETARRIKARFEANAEIMRARLLGL